MSRLLMTLLRNSVHPSRTANPAILHQQFGGSLVRNISVSMTRFHEDHPANKSDRPLSPRMAEFKEKLRQKTPIGKLDEIEGKHPYEEKEPLPAWPDNKNPHTGEVGGPKGPEPTRYGDWERKGRVTDF